MRNKQNKPTIPEDFSAVSEPTLQTGLRRYSQTRWKVYLAVMILERPNEHFQCTKSSVSKFINHKGLTSDTLKIFWLVGGASLSKVSRILALNPKQQFSISTRKGSMYKDYNSWISHYEKLINSPPNKNYPLDVTIIRLLAVIVRTKSLQEAAFIFGCSTKNFLTLLITCNLDYTAVIDELKKLVDENFIASYQLDMQNFNHQSSQAQEFMEVYPYFDKTIKETKEDMFQTESNRLYNGPVLQLSEKDFADFREAVLDNDENITTTETRPVDSSQASSPNSSLSETGDEDLMIETDIDITDINIDAWRTLCNTDNGGINTNALGFFGFFEPKFPVACNGDASISSEDLMDTSSEIDDLLREIFADSSYEIN